MKIYFLLKFINKIKNFIIIIYVKNFMKKFLSKIKEFLKNNKNRYKNQQISKKLKDEDPFIYK